MAIKTWWENHGYKVVLALVGLMFGVIAAIALESITH